MNKPKPIISIIVVTWDNLRYTQECLESILRYRPGFPFEVIVVDNGSKDGTVPYVQSLVQQYPDIFILHRNEVNRGYATGVNIGLKISQGHPLLLNNDTVIVSDRTFEVLLDTLERSPNVGAIGPVSNFVMGPQDIRESLRYPVTAAHYARFLIGFCILIRRTAMLSVGLLDDANFSPAGSDDLDYSIRLRKIGWKLLIHRGVFVWHHGSKTIDRIGGYPAVEPKTRQILIQKWGEKTVEELFLPIDLSLVRVLMCIPAWGSVSAHAYANHMIMMSEMCGQARHSGIGVDIICYPRAQISRVRCQAADTAIRNEYTHLFFWDDDMVAQTNGMIPRLIARSLPIVSAECYLRNPPFYPACFMDYGDRNGEVRNILEFPPGQDLVQVHCIGLAAAMIQTEALKQIKKVAGSRPLFAEGAVVPGTKATGEDIYFSKLCAEAGVPIFWDRSVQVGHLGDPFVIDRQAFEWQKQMAERQGKPIQGLVLDGNYRAPGDARKEGEELASERDESPSQERPRQMIGVV